MKTDGIVLATVLVAGMTSMVLADDAKKKAKGEKPKASPGWVIIEEQAFTVRSCLLSDEFVTTVS